MTIVTRFSNSVRRVEHFWITLKDGVRLSARMWLPEDAEANPVPAILEYIPYRKRDGTRGRDEPMHHYFAGHGYAAVRVDLRGTGESDGLLDDEYTQQELDDGCEVIAWIAAQKWCSGAVGMMGKSWGGFNCLQVAALRPPALKAVLSVCSTDDRYADDIHWMGGCLLNDNLWWGAIMLAYQARPADPELYGPDWRANWKQRLEHMPFWPSVWLKHQRRDAYWQHGSICENYADVQVPVFLIGGWADAYTNAIPRMLEHLKVPRKGVIGPWAHVYPQDGTPAPAIGFLQEAVKWWDRWLKNEQNGTEKEPMLRAWIENWTPPLGTRTESPGRWVAEESWPSPNIAPKSWYLNPDQCLSTGAGAARDLKIRSPLHVGQAGGEWMGAGCPGEHPTDQRVDDALSLSFDTPPLSSPLEILGAPELDLWIASDKPVAQIGVRLVDLAPDGAALRVSYQVLNLTHRDSHAVPTALEPGKRIRVKVKLNDCGHRFAVGHRIRVAISSGYWPLIWPSPEWATLTIGAGESKLILPVRGARAEDGKNPFAASETAPLTATTKLSQGRLERRFAYDSVNDRAIYVTDADGGVFGEGMVRFDEIGTAQDHHLKRELTISPSDPNSAAYTLTERYYLKREGPGDRWDIRADISCGMTSTKDTFTLWGKLEAFEDGKSVVKREWREDVPRDLV
jgi:putative CocE/NonD family hydrolase